MGTNDPNGQDDDAGEQADEAGESDGQPEQGGQPQGGQPQSGQPGGGQPQGGQPQDGQPQGGQPQGGQPAGQANQGQGNYQQGGQPRQGGGQNYQQGGQGQRGGGGNYQQGNQAQQGGYQQGGGQGQYGGGGQQYGQGGYQQQGTGLEPNVAAALSYVLGWITGIIFLVTEKEDEHVRFHAAQSIVVFGALNVVYIILWFIRGALLNPNPFSTGSLGMWRLVGTITTLFLLANLAIAIFLIYQAYEWNRFRVPIAAGIADNLASNNDRQSRQPQQSPPQR